MKNTKPFDKQLVESSRLFKVLGHPARLAILKYLSETPVCITGDITKEIPLSRTTVNQHLKELKELELIKGEIEGTKTNYCLNNTNISKLKETISGFLDEIKCCADSKC